MKRKIRKESDVGFQMAPMIDMVFLLLVFFMCVSSLAEADKSIPLDLPESDAAQIPEELVDRGTVSINAQGEIYLGIQKVGTAELKSAIKEWVRRRPDSRIVVRADREVPYETIRKVLQDCAESGAYEIVYASYGN